MKISLKYFLVATILLLTATQLYAVTKEEMEQARVIAAKCYLRFANNGSDYLDVLSPTTMAELEGKLKEKEKENIKAFKGVKVPTDYASWDKEKLVKYWSETFFSGSGLSEENKSIRSSTIKKRISEMTVSKPAEVAPQEENAAEKADPEEKKQEEIIASMPDDAVAEVYADSMQDVLDMEKNLEPVEVKSSSDSGTWIYVVILIILVALVLGLVIFASKTLGKNSNKTTQTSGGDNSEEIEEMETRFNNTLIAKNSEIRSLLSKCEDAENENSKLQMQLQMMKKEKEYLLSRISEMEEMIAGMPSGKGATKAALPKKKAELSSREGRVIYVGRVNSKGIFIRADREFNPAFDVYRLVTSDGRTGQFEIVDNDDLNEMIVVSPQAMLGNGCKGVKYSEISEDDRIVTIEPGEAIFENGYWRVVTKATIGIE